ncbi:unnamed protein product [Cylicocyclus nassatus]|uniref:Uncharacterized protein n=1 Tax=Cylicocyclus nassatus TaxID=53992 RepID=A0AA36MA02_CYLNA|nr:unnamed protein product [Cylicocyclus nassatus]
MGTSASAHKTAVKSISIDQNGWSRPCSATRGHSAASHRSLPVLSGFIGNKSSLDGGLTKADRIRLVDRAIKAETTAAECENKMKGMEREIRTLELRNHDLSTEVCWLRQQCTIPCPDAGNGSLASFVPPNCSEQCQVEKKMLQDTVSRQNADLSQLRMDCERLNAIDVRKDIRISELIKEVETGKARIAALEELCRNQMDGITSMTSSSSYECKEDVRKTEPSSEKSVETRAENEVAVGNHVGPTMAASTSSNAVTTKPRPTLRNIFTMGKEKRIDGKVRPSTASDSKTSGSFPPPLQRLDTVPILRSIEIMPAPPDGKEDQDEKTSTNVDDTNDDPYLNEKDLVECSDDNDDDSDIDITDILENSHKSITVSQRSQSSKSRDSGYSTRSIIHNRLHS